MRKKKPSYLLHRPSGQARVRINGRDIYIGPHGSRESFDRFDDLVAEWLTENSEEARYTLTTAELCLAYQRHADTYYTKDGRPTSEVHCIRLALRFVVKHAGRIRAREFTAKKLKAVREAMITAGLARTTINSNVNRIRRMFRWASAEEKIPSVVYHALRDLQGLARGRTKAPDPAPVQPVDEALVEKTLPYLAPVVRDMVRLQLLCGARPGEVCALRPCDVSRGSDGVWTYRPQSHKTQHHGRERRIYIGPRGQAILQPYLNRDAQAFCFSPAEAMEQHRARRNAEATSPRRPDQKRVPKANPKRTPRERYTKDGYGRSVARACELAFGMPDEFRKPPADATEAEREQLRQLAAEWRACHVWSPNQLRHSRATAIRQRYGLEGAQVVLGHSEANVTQLYAERDFNTAARIMAEVG